MKHNVDSTRLVEDQEYKGNTSTPDIEGILRDKGQFKGSGFFQQLLDTIPIPVFYKYFNGTYLGCNNAFAEYLGLTKDQVIGKSVYDLCPSDLAEVYHEADMTLFAQPGVQVYEALVLHADGSRHDVIFHKATYPGSDKQVDGLVGCIMDISERKKAEESLKKYRDRLESINTCIAGLGNDHASNFNRLTELCGEMLGATCALFNRLKGGLLCSLSRWQTPPDFRIEDTPAGHICYDVIRKGDDAPVLITDLPSTPYAESDPNVRLYGLKTYFGKVVKCEGKPVGALCVVYRDDYLPSEDDKRILDIIATAMGGEDSRSQLENALRFSEAKYRLLTEKMTDVVWTMGTDLQLTYISPSIEKVTGYSPDEFMSKDFSELMTPESLSLALKTMDRELGRDRDEGVNPNRTVNIELEYYHRNGSSIWMDLLCSAIRDEEGNITGIHGLSRDITERRQLTLDREKLVKDLQNALAEVKTLSGMLPICANCKKIRDDKGYWNQIESYITKHSEARFTHGLCPECAKKLYPDF